MKAYCLLCKRETDFKISRAEFNNEEIHLCGCCSECPTEFKRIFYYDDAIGIRKYTGLMFRTSKTHPLKFSFEDKTNLKIHSNFVFFPFEIIWLDENNNFIESKIIEPWQKSISCSKTFKSFLEFPIQSSNV